MYRLAVAIVAGVMVASVAARSSAQDDPRAATRNTGAVAASPMPDALTSDAVFTARMAQNSAAYRKLNSADSDYAARVANRTERSRIVADHRGENSIDYADALQLLAAEVDDGKHWAEDARIRLQALAIRRKLAGDTDSDTLYAVYATASSLAEAGRAGEAATLLGSVLSANGNDFSARYTDVKERFLVGGTVENKPMGMARALHARLLIQTGTNLPAAIASARLAASASNAYLESRSMGADDEHHFGFAESVPWMATGEDRFGEWNRLYADALWANGRRDDAAVDDVLRVAQVLTAGTTSRAVARSAAARYAAGAGVGALLGERDALLAEKGRLLTRTDARMPDAEKEALWARILMLGEKIDGMDARITAAAPDFYALIHPLPLNRAAVRATMGPDEAALLIFPTPLGTHVLLIDRDGLTWHRAALPETDLNTKVRRLLWNAGANVEVTAEEEAGWTAAEGGARAFDRGLAWSIYRDLIAPIEGRLGRRKNVVVVASGALSSLPFALLVTAPPQGADADPAALRATPWLGDRFALTQLPSLQSLQLLRANDRGGHAPGSRFLGYGDPVLGGEAETRGMTTSGRRRSGAMAGNVSVTTGADGVSLADVATLRTLARLPGTARELDAMTRIFPGAATVRLGAGATEARLKSESLTGLAVLAFSTHGLLAGEASQVGVNETGLVLTPPAQASARDDGLLTASEVAALRTDAEWVILSACNTAAGDGSSGAEGLSGLARSFFFAGARSLLVSNWPVRDDVAAVLTVKVLALHRAHPDWSRARALQTAEKAIRDDPTGDAAGLTWAHPNAWAPFTLVGDPVR